MSNDYINVSKLYTKDTLGIKYNDLSLIHSSAEDLSQAINITIGELYDKPFWFQYNGEYYYFKEIFSAFKLINELLGQYFSEYMDLPTVQYDIALYDDGIAGLLSKNFREKGKTYISARELPLQYYIYLDYLLKYVDGKSNELKRKIDALIVKDFYTCMIDRFANTLCTIDDTFDLAPLFDYEFSMSFKDIRGYIKEHAVYVTPLFKRFPYNNNSKIRTFDENTIKSLMKRDSQILEECKKMDEVDMIAVLDQIKDERKIKIPDEIAEYYITFYTQRKNRLRKILK